MSNVLSSLIAKQLEKLNENNWYEWKRLFKALLASLTEPLDSYLTTESPGPLPANATDEAKQARKILQANYKKQTASVLSAIIVYVSEDWRAQLDQQGHTTAKAAFEWLEQENVTILSHTRQQFRDTLIHLNMSGDDADVASYVTRAQTAYNTLQRMGDETVTQPAVMSSILNGLTAPFAIARDRIQADIAKPGDTCYDSISKLRAELVRVESEARTRARVEHTQPYGAAFAPVPPHAAFSALATPHAAPARPHRNNGKVCGYPPCRVKSGHTTEECHSKYLAENPTNDRLLSERPVLP